MKVSLADFCKLPIRDIGFDSGETSSRNTNIAVMPLLNSSFCTQISSTASGDKGACTDGVVSMTETQLVIPKRSSVKLPTQIAINEAGKVRTDFPFDSPNLSQCQKKELNYSTLFGSKHVNVKGLTVILAPETESDASTSFVFGQQGDPSHISETSDEEPIDMSVKNGGSEDRTFPTDNSLMTSCDPQGDGDTTVAENSSMVVNISNTTADCEKDVSDDYEAEQSESQEVADGDELYANDGQIPFEGDGEEDLFSEETNADVHLEGGSEETVTNTTKSSEVVPGEEDVKDVDAENPNDVQGGSDESVTNTNMTQQNEPEVVPSEDECAKPTDDPAVTEKVNAPKKTTVMSKKRKQRGKKCTVHGEIGGGDHGEKNVTIVVHSDVKKI